MSDDQPVNFTISESRQASEKSLNQPKEDIAIPETLQGGPSLEEEGKARIFSRPEIIRIALALCEQLIPLHEEVPPAAYGAIKPDNIHLEDGWYPRLSPRQEEDESTGETATPGKDVYDLGLLMNWLLHGKSVPLFEPRDGLEQIIYRCTCEEYKRRYHNASRVRKALLEL